MLVVKCFLEILQQGATPLHLHHNIIYVDVGISAELLEEAFLHATLKSGTGISQAECHSQVTEISEWVMKAVFRRLAGSNFICW